MAAGVVVRRCANCRLPVTADGIDWLSDGGLDCPAFPGGVGGSHVVFAAAQPEDGPPAPLPTITAAPPPMPGAVHIRMLSRDGVGGNVVVWEQVVPCTPGANWSEMFTWPVTIDEIHVGVY